MLQKAQNLIKELQDRAKTTIQVVADLAESIGVPTTLTSFLHSNEKWSNDQETIEDAEIVATEQKKEAPVEPMAAVEPISKAKKTEPKKERTPSKAKTTKKKASKARSKKRAVEGDRSKTADVKALEVDDAINGSTYLARIIWSLGIAQLEGLGPQRPADIARIVMSRSAVSLEPPNIARYIRRSKPTCITVAHTEGSSSFYKLNAQGKRIFEESFKA